MNKSAPYKNSRDYLEKNGIKLGRKSTSEDLKIAAFLAKSIRNIEKFIFSEQAGINLFDETNCWGITSVYHGKTEEYDIYVPGITKKFKEMLILFPEMAYLNDLNKQLIFVASHKVRHRLQKERNLSLFTPGYKSENYLINDIIRNVVSFKNYKECDCSVVEEKFKLREVEFDARVIQHYALTNLECLNPYPFFNIPVYTWRSVAKDISIEAL